MAMQTDVRASAPLAATGNFVTQNGASMTSRYRVKAIYAVCGASAGSVVFRTGGSGGQTIFTMNTPISNGVGYVWILMPGEGILFEDGVHGTLADVNSVVVFYG